MDFTTLSLAELATERATRAEAFAELIALSAPTVEQVAKASSLAEEIDAIDAQVVVIETAATEAAATFAELQNRKFGNDDADEEVEPEPADEEEAPAEEPAEVEVTVDATAPAKAAAKVATAAQIAARTARPAAPAAPVRAVSMVASAEVPGFSAGQDLESIDNLGKAVVNRMKGFTPPQGDGKSENLQKFGVATLTLPFESDHIIDRGSDDMEVMFRAASEERLDGGSLTAAGGWCSPSETMYDLKADESLEGILSIPEVQVNRGGIRYTVGPQFADFYAEAGFIQTETQAIAGTTKPCYEVDCPTFTDVRLDAVGLCIKVPILTNAAYPELVNRFTSGTLIAHQHMINANVIGRIVTYAGAARVIAGLGSTVADTLEGLELLADERRELYRLPLSRSLEVVLPFWVKGAMRSDLGRRIGQMDPVTDQQMMAHFAARNLAVQFVYDWQPIGQTAEVYPTTYNALMYPAGTFVKGVSDVINLSAVYDAASLAVNTYTGLFVEHGLLVAKMQYDADLITLPVCNAGRTGASNFTCA